MSGKFRVHDLCGAEPFRRKSSLAALYCLIIFFYEYALHRQHWLRQKYESLANNNPLLEPMSVLLRSSRVYSALPPRKEQKNAVLLVISGSLLDDQQHNKPGDSTYEPLFAQDSVEPFGCPQWSTSRMISIGTSRAKRPSASLLLELALQV